MIQTPLDQTPAGQISLYAGTVRISHFFLHSQGKIEEKEESSTGEWEEAHGMQSWWEG